MTREQVIALWETRRGTARKALRGVGMVQANLGDFPDEQVAMRKLYHKLNAYILLCYEQIADFGGPPVNMREENMGQDT